MKDKLRSKKTSNKKVVTTFATTTDAFYANLIATQRKAGKKIPPFHQAAGYFPPLTPAEFRALVESIRKDDLQETIVLHEGKILSGRYRWLACLVAGVEPRFVKWDGGADPVEFVIRANWYRRHLSDDQRAAIGLKLQRHWAAESRKSRAQKAAVKRHGKNGGVCSEDHGCPGERVREKAAKMLNVSQGKLRRAGELQELSENLFAQVETGDLRLNKALADARRHQQTNHHLNVWSNASRDIRKDLEQRIVCQDYRKYLGGLDGVDLIATDPPWNGNTVKSGLYRDFAKSAAKCLKPDGLVVMLVGTCHLEEIMAEVLRDGHLKFRGIGSYHTPRFTTKLHDRKIYSYQRPVLLLQKTGAKPSHWVKDYYEAGPVDAKLHDWAQSVAGFTSILEGVGQPDQIVVDPFCCTGTTLIAAVRLGMKFCGCDTDAKMVTLARGRVLEEINALKTAKSKLLGNNGDEEIALAA